MTNETRDALRNRLAERLLEVGLKECAPESFTDTHEEVEVGEGKTYADCLLVNSPLQADERAQTPEPQETEPVVPAPGCLGGVVAEDLPADRLCASLTLEEWYVKHAVAALAAATVIYPVEAADWTQAVSREESLVDQAGDVDASELPIREGA